MRSIILELGVLLTKPCVNSIPVVGVDKPDFVFSDEFDKDDDKSFSAMCDLEYKVTDLAKSFMALGYHVVVTRKEFSRIELNKVPIF